MAEIVIVCQSCGAELSGEFVIRHKSGREEAVLETELCRDCIRSAEDDAREEGRNEERP